MNSIFRKVAPMLLAAASVSPLFANAANTYGQIGVARTTSSYTLGAGSFNTGISIKGDYAYRDIRVENADGTVSKHTPFLLAQDVFFGYGLFNWLDASLDLPLYQDFWKSHDTQVGLGDLVFGLKMEHPGLYAEAPFRIAYLLRTSFPTGNANKGYYQRHSYYTDKGTNTEQAYTVGGYAFNPMMVWTLDLGKFPSRIPIQFHGNIGGVIKIYDTEGNGRQSQTSMLGNLATEFQFTPRWGGFVELSGEARLSEFVDGYNFITDLDNDVFRISAGPTLRTSSGLRSSLSFDVGISDRNVARTEWVMEEDGRKVRYTTTNTPRVGATLTLAYAHRSPTAGPARGRFFAIADTVVRVDTLKSQVLVRDTVMVVKNDTVKVTQRDTIVVVKNDTLKITMGQNPDAIVEYGARVFPSVNFITGSAELTTASYPVLNDLAQSLVKFPQVRLEVHGYTDATGSLEYNNKLSQDRANSVVDYLAQRGVPRERLAPVGKGPSNPIADNSSIEGRVLNRRVEIRRVD